MTTTTVHYLNFSALTAMMHSVEAEINFFNKKYVYHNAVPTDNESTQNDANLIAWDELKSVRNELKYLKGQGVDFTNATVKGIEYVMDLNK
jgi:hypothetical protein